MLQVCSSKINVHLILRVCVGRAAVAYGERLCLLEDHVIRKSVCFIVTVQG